MLNFVTKHFSCKVFSCAEEAIKDIKSGDVLLFGGFGYPGFAQNCLRALLKRNDLKDLTVVSDNCQTVKWGLGPFLAQKKVRKVIASFVGQNNIFQSLFLNGDMEVEIVPQGTLAEKLRCGGVGIPSFFTPTGVGTLVQEGGIPLKYRKDGTVEKYSIPKPVQIFNGKKFIQELSIRGDFALVKGWKGDTKGNVIFRKTARNFNIDAAMAGKTCICEVEKLVEPGQLDPDHIHLPGIFVKRIFKGERFEKPIEKLTTTESVSSKGKKVTEEFILRNKIAKRAAKEVKNGMYCNLGIGLPTLVPNYIPKGMIVDFHSENGMLGVGPYPKPSEVDSDLINPGKETVSETKGCAYFKSSDSFGIVRGDHLDVTILGGLQVSKWGDLSNWIIPNTLVKGMGGAMDLVASGNQVIVLMRHFFKGESKVRTQNTLPLTGPRCVSKLITDLGVFEFDPEKGITLMEIFDGVTIDEIKAKSDTTFEIANNLKTIKE